VVYETEPGAQREMVDGRMTRLQQFLTSERDVVDAMTVEESSPRNCASRWLHGSKPVGANASIRTIRVDPASNP